MDLKATLAALGWSSASLARRLGCHSTLPLAWLSGRAAVPVAVEAWLRELVRVQARNPPPPDWRTRSATAARATVHVGDCLPLLRQFADENFDMCLTSPPFYFVRDYGHADQIGLEPNQSDYIARLVTVFDEVRRVLKPTGSLWLHIADNRCTRRVIRPHPMRSRTRNGSGRSSTAAAEAEHTLPIAQFRTSGIKQGDLFLTPSTLALALRDAGWHVRSVIIVNKRNVVPETRRDRPITSHDYVLLLAKQAGGHVYNHSAEVGDRTVWDDLAPSPFRSQHMAAMSEMLAARCILSGSNPGARVLDPFGGVGTTAVVAQRHGRHCDLIELNPTYAALAQERVDGGSRA